MRALLAGLLALLCACGPGRQEAPEDRARALAPYWRLLAPEGPGPFPAAILLSGCDGVHDNMEFWARAFVASGRAALIVDSHRPRGLDRDGAWRLVCAGQIMRGATRAGDAAAALDALAGMPGIDASDVVLLGASHGGWAAMELVARAGAGAQAGTGTGTGTGAGEPIPGLARWPEPPDAMLGRISALVLLYPYCGALNRATARRWEGAPPTLMVLAGDDSIVSAPACARRAQALRGAGAVVEVAVLEGADHGFDQREKAALSTLEFDAGLRERARGLVRGFLAGRGS